MANFVDRSPPRLAPPSPGVFAREFARPQRPCVLTGVVERWRAQSWTPDFLTAQHGDVRFPVQRMSCRTAAPVQMSLAAYLDAIRQAPGAHDLYLSGVDLLGRIPALAADLDFPDYAGPRRLTSTLIFLGAAGARTPLHFDFCHTMLAQIAGRKRITLYAPAQTRQLDPLPRELLQTYSRLEVAPNGAVGPPAAGRAGPAPAYDFVLRPGELLFLPIGFWHAVSSLETSITITRSWLTLPMLATQAPFFVADWIKYQLRRWRSRGASAKAEDWLGF